MKRNQRALRVIRQLRNRQAKLNQKIDILCRDIVSAHGRFIFDMARMNFVCQLYEQMLAAADSQELLDLLLEAIQEYIPQASAAVFLLEPAGFEIHFAKSPSDGQMVEKEHFQSWFSRSIVNLISQTNRVLWTKDLLEMGLVVPPSTLKRIHLAAVPLGKLGQATGFILIYSPSEYPIEPQQICHIAGAASGIRNAFQRFKTISVEKI